jgi:hypothetical protein
VRRTSSTSPTRTRRVFPFYVGLGQNTIFPTGGFVLAEDGSYYARHNNGAAGESTSLVVYGARTATDDEEILGTIASDGAARGWYARNGGAATMGTEPAGAALAGAWAQQRLYVRASSAVIAVRAIKVQSGVKPMADMRAL